MFWLEGERKWLKEMLAKAYVQNVVQKLLIENVQSVIEKNPKMNDFYVCFIQIHAWDMILYSKTYKTLTKGSTFSQFDSIITKKWIYD